MADVLDVDVKEENEDFEIDEEGDRKFVCYLSLVHGSNK